MVSKKSILFSFFIFLIIFTIQSNLANSHSGRTNSEGCHNQTSNGTYHCHKPKSQKQNKSNNKVNAKVRVVDGDTIHIGKKKYRFSGIDTPEMKQTCEKDNQIVYCGLLAQKILKQKIGNQQITCLEEDEPDRYQRILAECFVNSESLSKFLVRNGYAFAYRKYSTKFVKDEEFAKDKKLGIWAMTFQYTWDFRKAT